MTMKKKSLPYREGTWFAVPLGKPGYAVGIVARMDGKGGVFGYFFGPKRNTVPTLDQVQWLRPSNAVYVTQFGDLGLFNGEWPIIGALDGWDRGQWPLPPFIRVDDFSGKAVKVIYDDNLGLISEKRCNRALAKRYPEDCLAGSGAVEDDLTDLLDG
jgi:hypothetical protein